MRITQVLWVVFPRTRRYRGLVYEGKNQKVKQLKTSYKITAANDVARESQNLTYLSKPYISQEEQLVYGTQHQDNREKKRAFLQKKLAERGFFPDRPLEEHLESLNVNKKWE